MTTSSFLPPRLAEAVIKPLRYISIIGPVSIVFNRHVMRDHFARRAHHPEASLPQTAHCRVANYVPLVELASTMPNGQRRLTRIEKTEQKAHVVLTASPRCHGEVRLARQAHPQLRQHHAVVE